MPIEPRPLAERFRTKVRRDPSGCLIWTASVNSMGYGRIFIGQGKYELSHRVAWRLAGRALTPGMDLDHTCRTPLCCEVEHIEQVTHRENILRGQAPSAVAHRTGVCGRGHLMNADNGCRDRLGKWRCNTCRRYLRRAHHAAQQGTP